MDAHDNVHKDFLSQTRSAVVVSLKSLNNNEEFRENLQGYEGATCPLLCVATYILCIEKACSVWDLEFTA
jgi:hypothetical protein